MLVDFYKNKTSVVPVGRPRDVMYYLERIKDGAVKKTIESLRCELDKDKRNEIKGQAKPRIDFEE